jgi:DNA-binding response OmpR family regulator
MHMTTEATMPKVLVVEDDAAMRALLTTQLRRKGFEVSSAADAESVLKEPNASTGYDLIVSDVHLPGRSGVEMARHLRKGDAEPRVVFVTGDADESLAREALEEGASGYLLKPFEFFELEAMVRAALKPVQTVMRYAMGADLAPPAPVMGRNVTRVVDEQRALQRFQQAVQRPEKVVIRQGRSRTKRPSLVPWKAVAAIAATIVLSWIAGSIVFPAGRAPSEASASTITQSASSGPQMMPIVIEAKSYVPAGR